MSEKHTPEPDPSVSLVMTTSELSRYQACRAALSGIQDPQAFMEAVGDVRDSLETTLRWLHEVTDSSVLRGMGGDDGQGHYEGEVLFGASMTRARQALSNLQKARGE